MMVKRSESVVSYDDVARAQVRTARRMISSLLVAEYWQCSNADMYVYMIVYYTLILLSAFVKHCGYRLRQTLRQIPDRSDAC